MYDYYCKNCNNIIGKWYNEYKDYDILYYCNFTNSTNITIKFLDCKNCNKFIGILCYLVCTNCFGKDIIIEEKKLFKWFQKYKKIKKFEYNTGFCKICNNNKFRRQCWYFKELIFCK